LLGKVLLPDELRSALGIIDAEEDEAAEDKIRVALFED
jgi:hypothetical protein